MMTSGVLTYLSCSQSGQSTIIVGNYAVVDLRTLELPCRRCEVEALKMLEEMVVGIYLLELLLPHSHHVYLLLTLGILWERAEESNLSFSPA